MRILHLSSFTGNIGDNLSNIGTYNILRDLCGPFSVDELEVRKTYRNYNYPDKWQFDLKFVEQVNEYDLLVIGGGAFFDYFIDDSDTGMTLEMSESLLEMLTPDIIVMSMGCLSRGHEHNYGKAAKIINRLNDRAGIFFRNDGSVEKFPDIPEVLDSGFFYEGKRKPGGVVVVSVGTYELENTNTYIDEMAKYISRTENVIVVPHVLSDLKLIADILSKVNKPVTVAPPIQGWAGLELFNLYAQGSLVVSARYHGCIAAIALGVPVVGIGVSPKVKYLFSSLDAEAVKPVEGFSDMIGSGEVFKVDKRQTLEKYGRWFGGAR